MIERAPSAELRPDQLDSDSLPPYELLDRILEAYVERDEGREEMIAAGMPAEVVDEVVRMVDRSEYKRRQAAPGNPDHAEGLRPRPPAADHQSLRRLAQARLTAIVICARAQSAVLGVDDLGVPDPGGAAAVAGPGPDFGARPRGSGA